MIHSSAHPGFLSPTGVEITFVLVGLATLGAAVVTVTTRQLVHAALWLVVALGGLAVEYLLLTAEFIAWVQVLIYVGSVVVLLLFGLMLTKAPIGRSPDADSENRWVALGVAVVAAGTLVWVVVRRLPHHLDRLCTARARAPPRSPGPASSGTGCCPSRRCRCCCWPRWSAPSCSPAAKPQPPPTARTPDAPHLPRRPRRPPLLRRRVRRARPAQRDPRPDVRRADAQRRQPQPRRLRHLARATPCTPARRSPCSPSPSPPPRSGSAWPSCCSSTATAAPPTSTASPASPTRPRSRTPRSPRPAADAEKAEATA